MPTCVIATTEKFSKSDGQAIIKKISQTVAKMLGKPEHVRNMCFTLCDIDRLPGTSISFSKKLAVV